jgi:hypothetical protein
LDETYVHSASIGKTAPAARTHLASIRRGLLRIESTAITAISLVLAGTSALGLLGPAEYWWIWGGMGTVGVGLVVRGTCIQDARTTRRMQNMLRRIEAGTRRLHSATLEQSLLRGAGYHATCTQAIINGRLGGANTRNELDMWLLALCNAACSLDWLITDSRVITEARKAGEHHSGGVEATERVSADQLLRVLPELIGPALQTRKLNRREIERLRQLRECAFSVPASLWQSIEAIAAISRAVAQRPAGSNNEVARDHEQILHQRKQLEADALRLRRLADAYDIVVDEH